MSRAFLIVIDSFGCGGAPDAAAYGDEGADTLGHIAAACAAGRGDREGLRRGPLALPHLGALGLGFAGKIATGHWPAGLTREVRPDALFGAARETALGKDTPSGHWEIAGAPAPFAWGYFPETIPTFPAELTQAVIREGGLPGILGDRHASGVEIIDTFGEEHVATGKPILYTSVDSVLQIAAHEEHFGLQRLYDLCELVRRLVDPLRIGRVIARPFIGETRETFRRTPRRKDFAIPPPDGTILHRAVEAGREVVSIGKIGDIFAHRFTGREMKGASNDEHLDMTLAALETLADGGFCFVNLVDLDTDYGHRRDVAGYAAGLERIDAKLPAFFDRLRPGDLMIFTADHGNDPTWRGTDHTREQVPVVGLAPGLAGGSLGGRPSFADLGASVADWLGLPATPKGVSFLNGRKPAG